VGLAGQRWAPYVSGFVSMIGRPALSGLKEKGKMLNLRWAKTHGVDGPSPSCRPGWLSLPLLSRLDRPIGPRPKACQAGAGLPAWSTGSAAARCRSHVALTAWIRCGIVCGWSYNPLWLCVATSWCGLAWVRLGFSRGSCSGERMAGCEAAGWSGLNSGAWCGVSVSKRLCL
jgi:hypothetical protein